MCHVAKHQVNQTTKCTKGKLRLETSVERTDRKVSTNAAVKIGRKHVRDQNS